MSLKRTSRTRTRAQTFALSPSDLQQLVAFISLLHQVDQRTNICRRAKKVRSKEVSKAWIKNQVLSFLATALSLSNCLFVCLRYVLYDRHGSNSFTQRPIHAH